MHHDDKTKTHTETHGAVDPLLITTEKGKQAVKWSFIGLMLTAIVQIIIVYISGSAALLADTVHNFSDAITALPLWIAFSLIRKKPSKRFTYGYGRMEDVAGLVIVILIIFSGFFAAYQAFELLKYPKTIEYVEVVALAGVVGFFGNEAIAKFRIKVGKEIGSAALIADGYHARVDGFTSLAVLAGAVGVWLGYPLADPIIAFIITIAILKIAWESGKMVFSRILDGVDPEVIDDIRNAVNDVEGVRGITSIRVRWIGHRLHTEVNVTVDSDLSVKEGHDITIDVRQKLMKNVAYISGTTIHVDPLDVVDECELNGYW
ncbi:cation diffusion facilitator family transporter [Methanolobus sp. ZRKC3]|uniref:cation diffusion facilitator family transporter n=1 Tax=Methanolobus sp. ZRKC3 TaxID=3125786 RepID=UPI003244CBAD